MPAEQLVELGPRALETLRGAVVTVPVRTIPAVATDAAVVLGRGQTLPADTPAGVRVLRRATGGGAVLVDPDLLSVDVVVRTGHPWLEGQLTDVFRPIGEAWAAVLRAVGVAGVVVHDAASTARRQDGDLAAEVCFAARSYGEVLVGGRKLVGLAQRRRREGALVACGVLRRWKPEPILAVLRPGEPVPGSLAHAAVGLAELGIAVTFEELADAFEQRLARAT